MAFLVFRRPKMIEKTYAALILPVKSKSEEKSKLSLLEKKISDFCLQRYFENSEKIIKFNHKIHFEYQYHKK